jgi:hypothetical protein
MPVYHYLPTADTWKHDCELKGLFKKTEFPALARITELLAQYPMMDRRLKAVRREMQYQMWRHTQFILKTSRDENTIGAKVKGRQLGAVNALNVYLTQLLRANSAEFMMEFGRGVGEGERENDARLLETQSIEWFIAEAARKALKLSFRSGIAYRWYYPSDTQRILQTYDSQQFREDVDLGAGIFVMDQKGRIYIGGREDEKTFKHSSFLAGGMVLAAGTMRFETGQLVRLTGRSGHYRPTVQQMVNVLERLSAYQVDLSKVTVYRENNAPKYEPKCLEPMAATELIQLRAWHGVDPTSMHVRLS